MATTAAANGLHLPSLSISGFRGIKRLRMPELGQVTLLGGKNSSGKTTVLEAVRAYAARGRQLSALIEGRDEYSTSLDEDGDKVAVPDPAALFHGRTVSRTSEMLIGPDIATADRLSIKAVPSGEPIGVLQELSQLESLESLVIHVEFGNGKRMLPWPPPPTARWPGKTMPLSFYSRYPKLRDAPADLPSALNFHWLGPGVVSNRQLADLWADIMLTDAEDRATRALEMVVGDPVDRIAMFASRTRQMEHQVSVRLRDQTTPVPLRSLGDGAVRVFAVALALANASGGFLFIDEAENGIHHTVHPDFWRMVLQAALDGDVQVLATTHSFSCVRGFALACAESETRQGVYVRLERRSDETKAVTYTRDELEVVAEQGIEVR